MIYFQNNVLRKFTTNAQIMAASDASLIVLFLLLLLLLLLLFFLLALQPPLGVVFYSPIAGFSILAYEVT